MLSSPSNGGITSVCVCCLGLLPWLCACLCALSRTSRVSPDPRRMGARKILKKLNVERAWEQGWLAIFCWRMQSNLKTKWVIKMGGLSPWLIGHGFCLNWKGNCHGHPPGTDHGQAVMLGPLAFPCPWCESFLLLFLVCIGMHCLLYLEI